MTREYYIVSVDRPDDVSVTEMKDYIQTAVTGWKGGMNSDEPLLYAFEGYGKAVYVQRMGLGAKYVVNEVDGSDRDGAKTRLDRDYTAEQSSSKAH